MSKEDLIRRGDLIEAMNELGHFSDDDYIIETINSIPAIKCEPIAWMWDNNGVTEYTQDIYSVEYYFKTYGVEMTPLYTKIKDK